ncbi:MAG: ABC transporter permease [Fimbriimonadia bacterium]|nr:ABC transporter permease [Fimbriimonadia bacterium]
MNATLAIARATFGEAIRKRVLLIILLVALLILLVTPAFEVLAVREQKTILTSFGLGIIQLAGALIAIILCINMIPQEIERRTIYTILSKPVLRHHFVLGKFLGAMQTLAFAFLLMGVAFMLVMYLTLREIDPKVVKGLIMFFFQSSLLAGVTLFFSTFASPLVNFFLSGGTFLVGNILSNFLNTIEKNPQVGSMTRIPVQILVLLMPNFANFNVQNPIINPEQQLTDETAYLVQTVAYGGVYICLLLVAAVLIFNQREM